MEAESVDGNSVLKRKNIQKISCDCEDMKLCALLCKKPKGRQKQKSVWQAVQTEDPSSVFWSER